MTQSAAPGALGCRGDEDRLDNAYTAPCVLCRGIAVGTGAKLSGVAVQSYDLGAVQACLGHEQQQGLIEASELCRPIGRDNDRPDLGGAS